MKTTLISLVLPLLALQATSAQPNSNLLTTTGTFLSVHLNGSSWSVEDSDSESGVGLGLMGGYGVSEVVSIYLQLDVANINPDLGGNYLLGHGDLGVRFLFETSLPALRPFADVSLTGQAAEFEIGTTTFEASGGGIALGGGLQFFTSPAIALNASVKYTLGKLTEVKVGSVSVDTDFDARSLRFNLGAVYYLGR